MLAAACLGGGGRVAAGFEDPFAEIPEELEDDDGEDDEESHVDAVVEGVEVGGVASGVEVRVPEQDEDLTWRAEEHDEGDEPEGLVDDVLEGLRALPGSAGEVDAAPEELYDVERDDPDVKEEQDGRELEGRVAEVFRAGAKEQVRILRDEQEPDEKEESEDELGDGKGEAAGAGAAGWVLLQRRQGGGRPLGDLLEDRRGQRGIVGGEELQCGKDERDRRGDGEQDPGRAEDGERDGRRGGLAEDDEEGGDDGVNDERPEQRGAEHEPVHGKDGWADEGLLRLIARGDEHGRAKLAEPVLGFPLGERAAECGFLVLELGFKVGAEFGEDVLLAGAGQMLFRGLEITVEEFHGVFFPGNHSDWPRMR